MKSLSECPTLHDTMDCSLPGSSIHGIFKARVLEWLAIAFSVRVDNTYEKHQRASLVAQRLKRLPAMWVTWVRSLGWEDPLEEGMAIHSSILTRRIPMERGARWATVHGVTESWTRLRD